MKKSDFLGSGYPTDPYPSYPTFEIILVTTVYCSTNIAFSQDALRLPKTEIAPWTHHGCLEPATLRSTTEDLKAQAVWWYMYIWPTSSNCCSITPCTRKTQSLSGTTGWDDAKVELVLLQQISAGAMHQMADDGTAVVPTLWRYLPDLTCNDVLQLISLPKIHFFLANLIHP